ncbi:hypothetical protein [Acinetobacter seifertii]|uniref:hypothetical protein n=1 Tax=Acinetobacter seifertii TaxID=1530123 RepID=UPI0032B557B6
MRKLSIACLMGLVMLSTSGCSVFMAGNQPSKKNLNVLNPGSSRNYVIAELGAPVLSEYRDGTRVEIYTFQQGYPKWAKVSRAFGHGIADVASFGLWEVFGTPTEAYFSGKETSYEVTYGQDDVVKSFKLIDFEQAFPKLKAE